MASIGEHVRVPLSRAGVWLVSTRPNTHSWPSGGRPRCFCKIIQINTSDCMFLHFSATCTFTYLRRMFEQCFIYLDNHTRDTQHHRGIPVEQSPATNVSEVLICLDARHFSHFCFLCSSDYWVFPTPSVHQDQPLLQRKLGLFKNLPSLRLLDFLQVGSGHRHLPWIPVTCYYIVIFRYFS